MRHDRIVGVVLILFGIAWYLPELIAGLSCYNGCGVQGTTDAFCVTHKKAYLIYHVGGNGEPQQCAADDDRCSKVVILNKTTNKRYVTKGCDKHAACLQRQQLVGYDTGEIGVIEENYCCDGPDYCNSASQFWLSPIFITLPFIYYGSYE